MVSVCGTFSMSSFCFATITNKSKVVSEAMFLTGKWKDVSSLYCALLHLSLLMI